MICTRARWASLRCWVCAVVFSVAQVAAEQDAHAQGFGELMTARDLATLRALHSMSVSSNGAWVTYQVYEPDPDANRYAISWFVVPADGTTAARRIADGGEIILAPYQGLVSGAIEPAPVAWDPDGDWIAFARKEGGRTAIWRARRDGRGVRQLTNNAGEVRALAFSRRGDLLLFQTAPSEADIAEELEREGRAGFLYDSRFLPNYDPTRPILPADSNRVETGQFTAAQVAAHRIWAYELRSGVERPASESEQAEFAALTGSPRPTDRAGFRSNFLTSGGTNGALAWVEALDPALQGGVPPVTIVAQHHGRSEPIVCAAPECTGQSIKGLWWRNDREVVFARGEGPLFHDTTLYSWTLGAHEVRRIASTENMFTWQFGGDWPCFVVADRLICFYEEANRPRRLVSIDLNHGSVQTLHDPNPDFLRFNLGASPRRVVFHLADGGETYGYLVLPPRGQRGERLPLVIVTYRCRGFLRGGSPGEETPVFPLASRGYAVLCFNIPSDDFTRLASESYDRYIAWGRGVGAPLQHRIQGGLNAAVDQLYDMGIIDRDRVALTGLSYGAATVSFALFSMPHLAAAISSGGSVDPSAYYLGGDAVRANLEAIGIGAPASTPDRWRTLSLALNADRVNAPLLLNVADHEVLISLEAVTALRDAGRNVEMRIFPDEYHVKWQPAHLLAIYTASIDWLEFWLRGVEDQDPIKAPQYERWRAMRGATADK